MVVTATGGQEISGGQQDASVNFSVCTTPWKNSALFFVLRASPNFACKPEPPIYHQLNSLYSQNLKLFETSISLRGLILRRIRRGYIVVRARGLYILLF